MPGVKFLQINFIFFVVAIGPFLCAADESTCASVLAHERRLISTIRENLGRPSGSGFVLFPLGIDQTSSLSKGEVIAVLNSIFDLFPPEDLRPFGDFDHLIIRLFDRPENSTPQKPGWFSDPSVNWKRSDEFQRHIERLTPFLRSLVTVVHAGLDPRERMHLIVTDVDFRRYKKDVPEPEDYPKNRFAERHVDGNGLGATVTFSGNGTIVYNRNETLRTSSWELAVLSGRYRSIYVSDELLTEHKSPASDSGRLFMRISFAYAETTVDTIALFESMLAQALSPRKR